MKKILVALFPVLLVGVSAQHAMHIEVRPDRIAIGGDFVPRFLDLPQTLVVARGASARLNAGTYDYIEVGGTLTIPAVEVRSTHLVVLPGGTLIVECGATIIGRNVPIDTARDPFQWGNGLLNFGTLRAVCPEKTPFVQVAGDAGAGAATLTLASEAVGWAVGDELVLPDTRQMMTLGRGVTKPRRETGTTISGIAGTTLTLSKPLAFARDAIRRPDGSIVLPPRVANLTRRTVIRSENPDGVRWHTANVGLGASWDVQGVAFVGLGRTRNEALNSTTADRSHIGTNQVGRYAFHVHHVGSSKAVRRISSSAFAGVDGGKWGVVVHQSHDTEVLNNVCVDTPGSCFVTEDGNEVRNVFRGNFAAFVTGNGVGSVQNVDRGCPGCESAYWFRGVNNVIENNEAWNSQMGFDLFNQRHQSKTATIPTEKGGSTMVVPNLALSVPMSMKNNLAASNAVHGVEYWSLVPFPNERMTLAHNGQRQAWNAFPERSAEMYLVDASVICANGQTLGIVSGQGYTTGLEMLRGEIRGCDVGLAHGIAKVYGRFTETVFQNAKDIWFIQHMAWPRELRMTRVRHEPLGSNKPTFIGVGDLPAWSGSGRFPADVGGWAAVNGSGARIEDWQGTGQNYRLVYPSQVSSSLAWPATHPIQHFMLPPPECGTTLGETWERCGMSFGGAPFSPGTDVALPGLVGLVALPEARKPLGPPRAIMTTPNARGSSTNFIDKEGRLKLNFALTGNPALADDMAYLSIDGGSRLVTRSRPGGGTFFVSITTDVLTEGTHIVRTWRELNGEKVPGSAMTFRYVIGAGTPHYVIGAGTPPPPPPPPPPTDPCETDRSCTR